MRCCEGCVIYTGLRQGVARALPFGHFDPLKVVEIFAFGALTHRSDRDASQRIK
jgi:hypothetical protein